MPPIRNARELTEQARNRNFLNSSSPQYQTVNRFTQKLMDLQTQLRDNTNVALKEQVTNFSRDLMNLQMHNTPMVSRDALEASITSVTVDLPYYLKTPGKGGDEKTGYQQLVEAGEKYGVFTKAELDEAMTLVGQGMGVDMGLDGLEEEKEKEAQLQAEEEAQRLQMEAEQQAVIDAQANIAIFDKQAEQEEAEQKKKAEEREQEWRAKQEEANRKDETEYHYHVKPDDLKTDDVALLHMGKYAARNAFRSMGILKSEEDKQIPENNGVPSIFTVKNGKVSSLAEAGLTLDSDEFVNAMLRGEIYAYPVGEKDPVQMQADIRNDSMKITHGKPLEFNGPIQTPEAKMPKEPKISRQPRWYHRWFPFWGDNRKICQDFAATSAAHDKWEKHCERLRNASDEARTNAIAIHDKFGGKRKKEALEAELKNGFLRAEEARKEENRKELELAQKNAEEMNHGIDVVRNIYAAKPEYQERFLQKNHLYTKERFNMLSQTDLDPTKTVIGGKPLTQEDFAALAMFGGMNAETGVKAYQGNHPRTAPYEPMKEALMKEGYSEAEMKTLVSKISVGAYSVDAVKNDDRMFGYFKTGVNEGRKVAAEALQAYPQDKTKLAAILANAVGQAGELAGSTEYESDAFVGVKGVVKLSADMIELMERDPELKNLAKEQHDKQEREFCTAINKQISKYAPDHPNALKPRSFEENIKSIRDFKKFSELHEKGLDARQKLAKAHAEDKPMPEEQKKECVKDILKANMAGALYNKEFKERSSSAKPNGVNDGHVALSKYRDALQQRAPLASGEDEEEELAERMPKEEIIPWSVPNVVLSSLETRFTEKAPVVGLTAQEKELKALDKQAEKIMEQDGLDKLEPGAILETVKKQYARDNMMIRASKLAGPQQPQQEGPAQPELNKQQALGEEQPELNKQQEQGEEQLQLGGPVA